MALLIACFDARIRDAQTWLDSDECFCAHAKKIQLRSREKASGFEVRRPPPVSFFWGSLLLCILWGMAVMIFSSWRRRWRSWSRHMSSIWKCLGKRSWSLAFLENAHWAWFLTAGRLWSRIKIQLSNSFFFLEGNLSKCPHFFVYDWGGERSLAGSDQHAILCKWRGMSLATSQHKFLGEVAAWFNTVLSPVWTLQPEEPPVCRKPHAGCGRLDMHGMYVWLLFCSIEGSRRPDIYLPALSSRFCSALWSFVPVRAMWFWRISRCCGWQLLQALWEGWVSRWKRTKYLHSLPQQENNTCSGGSFGDRLRLWSN